MLRVEQRKEGVSVFPPVEIHDDDVHVDVEDVVVVTTTMLLLLVVVALR